VFRDNVETKKQSKERVRKMERERTRGLVGGDQTKPLRMEKRKRSQKTISKIKGRAVPKQSKK